MLSLLLIIRVVQGVTAVDPTRQPFAIEAGGYLHPESWASRVMPPGLACIDAM